MAKPKQTWFVSSEMFTFSKKKVTRKVRTIETKSTPLSALKTLQKNLYETQFLKVCVCQIGPARQSAHPPPRSRRDANKAQSTYLSSKWDAFTVICSKTYTRKQTTMLAGTPCLVSGESGQSVKCENSSVNCWPKPKKKKIRKKCQTQNCRKSDTHWCKIIRTRHSCKYFFFRKLKLGFSTNEMTCCQSNFCQKWHLVFFSSDWLNFLTRQCRSPWNVWQFVRALLD